MTKAHAAETASNDEILLFLVEALRRHEAKHVQVGTVYADLVSKICPLVKARAVGRISRLNGSSSRYF